MDSLSIPPSMPRLPEPEEEEIETQRTLSESVEDEEPVEVKLRKAAEQKEKGNSYFAQKNFDGAREAYLEGIKVLKNIPTAQDMLMALQGNASLMSLKLEDYDACIKHSDEALALDANNMKVLHRRVVAYMNTNHYDEAKRDLIILIRNEPSKKEFRDLYDKAIAEAKKDSDQRKQAYSGIFKKSLYADKEKELKERLKQEEKNEAKLKSEWEDEMMKSAEKGEDQQDFESWKAIKKEMNTFTPPVTPPAPADNEKPAPTKRPIAPKEESEEEYTEAEKKLLDGLKGKGYCYFKDRELTEEEKAKKTKINLNTPQAVTDNEASAPQPVDNKAISSWNSQGTSYEEKTVTKWAEEVLKGLLLSSSDKLPNGSQLSITSAELQGGEANIAVISGSKRYIYDFEYKFTVQVKSADGSKSSEIIVHCSPSNVADSTHAWVDDAVFSSSIHKCGEDAQSVRDLMRKIFRICLEEFEENYRKL